MYFKTNDCPDLYRCNKKDCDYKGFNFKNFRVHFEYNHKDIMNTWHESFKDIFILQLISVYEFNELDAITGNYTYY